MLGLSIRSMIALTLVAALTPVPMPGQTQLDRARLLIGVSLNSLRTNHPEGGIITVGALLGLEQPVTSKAVVRAVATVNRGVLGPDDIALCHPIPGGCLADGVFPKWLLGISFDASVAPTPRSPVRFVAGLGGQFLADPAEKDGSRPIGLKDSRFAAIWRVGLEVPLGSSPRAGRLQLARTGFARPQYSVTGSDGISLTARK